MANGELYSEWGVTWIALPVDEYRGRVFVLTAYAAYHAPVIGTGTRQKGAA